MVIILTQILTDMPIWFYFVLAFIVLDILLVGYIFIQKHKRKGFASSDLKYLQTHWDKIARNLEYDPKHAVLDADKLLDYALKAKGFSGSLGEKLKKAGPRFSDLDGVWSAHKLRNKLAHEIMDLKVKDAKIALSQFRRALNDLGAGL